MAGYDDYDDDYNEWEDYDASGIFYNDHPIAGDIVSNPHTEIVVLSDSDDTVEYDVENNNPLLQQPRISGNDQPRSSSSESSEPHENNTLSTRDNLPQVVDEQERVKQIVKHKLEMEILKENKRLALLKEKRMKLLIAVQQRSKKPEEAIKRLIVHIDTNIVNNPQGSMIIPTLLKADIKYKVNILREENTITWTHMVPQAYMDDSENVCTRQTEVTTDSIILVMHWRQLIDLIKSNMLIKLITRVKRYPYERLTILIFELDKYLNFHANKLNRALKSTINGSQQPKTKLSEREKEMEDGPVLSAENIELALTEAQIITNTCHRKYENAEDIANFVFQMTRGLSVYVTKARNEKEQQTLSWFAKADSKAGVNVDKNGNGLVQLWQQQLFQFNKVGIEVVLAIISRYNSPQSLLAAYRQCKHLKEAEELLSNIMVRRNAGVYSSSRRVGSELSKKIYRFFTSTNPTITIS